MARLPPQIRPDFDVSEAAQDFDLSVISPHFNTVCLASFCGTGGFEADILLEEDTIELLLPFRTIEGKGVLSVSIDGELLYSEEIDGDNFPEDFSATVPVAKFAGRLVPLKVAVDPIGDEPVSVYIDQIVTRVLAPIKDANSILDQDNDLLPDIWELAKFGNLDSAGDKDNDGDGLSNAFESAFGRNPEVKEEGGGFEIKTLSDGNVRLSFQRAWGAEGSTSEFLLDGQRTILECSSDLETWQPISREMVLLEAGGSSFGLPSQHVITIRSDDAKYFRWRTYSDSNVLRETPRLVHPPILPPVLPPVLPLVLPPVVTPPDSE